MSENLCSECGGIKPDPYTDDNNCHEVCQTCEKIIYFKEVNNDYLCDECYNLVCADCAKKANDVLEIPTLHAFKKCLWCIRQSVDMVYDQYKFVKVSNLNKLEEELKELREITWNMEFGPGNKYYHQAKKKFQEEMSETKK